MGSSYLHHFIPFLLSCASIMFAKSLPSSSMPRGKEDERSALLQFRKSFSTTCEHPRVAAWDVGMNNGASGGSYCMWDGVECDEDTSHVVSLDLSSSCLHGTLSATNSLFRLVHLRSLSLAYNHFANSEIPPEIGRFHDLRSLNLSSSHLTGQIPREITRLSKLSMLDLSGNSINIQPPSSHSPLWLSKLTELTHLSISGLNYAGQFPLALANLTKLQTLNASNNELVGPVPSWLMNLTQLQSVVLDHNNRLTVNFDIFLKLEHLSFLSLNGLNSILFSNQNDTGQASPKFHYLSLSNCNLTIFPQFLRYQNELRELDLANNQIYGKVPQWLLNASNGTLITLDLSSNFLTEFENSGKMFPSYDLRSLDLCYNMFQGSFPPIHFPNIRAYMISHNSITGEIPDWICNSSFLRWLELTNNQLTGEIPSCIVEKLANSLALLNLKGNNLHGSIPQNFSASCQLQLIDLSQNQLEGWLPRSLTNCRPLQLLDVGWNHINDTFPSWLGNLQGLRALILHYNSFYGTVGAPTSTLEFPSLHIISLSHNSHTGCLPIEYIQNWHAMKTTDQDQSLYYMTLNNLSVPMPSISMVDVIESSFNITITNKGTATSYLKILNNFKAIDLSSNKFHGEIPNSIGNLMGLKALNFSNNDFTGAIPSSLVNITRLESLDLSHNKLSGVVPEELTLLTFLEVFNVSYNHLEGVIPQGKQFSTFENSSFVGNQLCGDPLSKRCGDVDDASSSPPSPSTQDESDDDSVLMDWIIRLLGYGSGLIIGFVIGQTTITNKHHQWLVNTLGRRNRNKIKV